MRSQLNEETDDEYFDDPIKLFDFEHDRVHFGSLAIQDNNVYKNTVNISEFKLLTDNLGIKSGSEVSVIDRSLVHLSERECHPLYIKLVDCSKFPWYYKKYTQQILDKTNIYDLVTDSDSEIEIKDIDDTSDDCFIVDMANEPNTTKSKECVSSFVLWPYVTLKTIADKRKEAIRRKEDIEIQKALSQRHTGKIDFKRNKGLIGMTITQKFVNNADQTTADTRVNNTTITKVKEKKRNNSHINTKFLNNIKTTSTDILKVPETKTEGYISSSTPSKRTVKLSSKKMSELVEHIKIKKSHKNSQVTKLPENKINKDFNKQTLYGNLSNSLKLSNSSNSKKSSHTVKNIKKTTKYKKKKLEVFETNLLRLLESEKNKKAHNSETRKGDKNPNKEVNKSKLIEKKYEPHSPILPCSTLAKKGRNINENRDIRDEKSIHKSHTLYQLLNESKSINFNNSAGVHKTPKESTNPQKQTQANIIYSKVGDHKNEATETLKEAPIQCNVILKSNVPINNIQPSSSSHTDITSTTQSRFSVSYNISNNPNQFCFANPANMTSCVPNVAGLNGSQNISNNIAPGMRVIASNQGSNIVSSSNNNNIMPLSGANALTSQCKLVSVTNDCGNIKLTKGHNLSVRSNSDKEAIINNFNNVPSHNSYTSAIILRPTQTNNFSNSVRYTQAISNTQRPAKISVQMQPRFYHNPYKSYNRLSHNQDQRFSPRAINYLTPNYRFPTPRNNNTHTSWYMPNIYPKFDPRSVCPRNVFPPRLPLSVLQRTPTPPSAKFGFVSQSDYIDQPIRIQQGVQAHNKQDNTVTIKSLDPRRTSLGCKEDIVKINADKKDVTLEENSDLVTTKTKMLEFLDSATNDLKRSIDDDDNDIEKKLGEVFKRPKVSNEGEITVDKEYCEKINQQKGYSPPILPIPTFEHLMDQVESEGQKQDKPKVEIISQVNVSKEVKYTNENYKRLINKTQESDINKKKDDRQRKAAGSKSQEIPRQEDIKKISLEEYKQRISGYRSEDYNKRGGYVKKDFNRKRWITLNKAKSSVNRRSTESDHGYDSDSTVIL